MGHITESGLITEYFTQNGGVTMACKGKGGKSKGNKTKKSGGCKK